MAIESTSPGRVVVLLALLAMLPYLNALPAGFTLDDEPTIRSNPAVTGGVDLLQILTSPLSPGDLYRPLTTLTFALNERLSPAVAWPFHAVNVGLHAAVTLLVFWLAARLFASTRLALVAAALFAVHPIHTEAVTSLVGRAEVLAALFGLVALLSAVQMDRAAHRVARLALAAVSVTGFSLALLSKESALTLLMLIPLLRITCRGESLSGGLRRELYSLDWVPYALCAVLFLLLRFAVVGTLTASHSVTPLDNMLAFAPVGVRLRSAVAVLWDYFGLLQLPINLAADYSHAQVPVVTRWFDPRVLAGLALVLVAAVLLWHPQPAVRFAVVLPFVTLALSANLLFPIGTIKAERLLYFPSVGWVLIAAYVFDRLIRVLRYRSIAVVLLAVAVAAFAARTWTRNRDWRDNLVLSASMARSAPDSAKSRLNFGVALRLEGDEDAAVAQFHRALAIYRWIPGAAFEIGLSLERRARPDEAMAWYQRALEIDPAFGKAHTNLCALLLTAGRYGAASTACRNGLRYDPTDANLLKGLGASLVSAGETEKGLEVLRRSLALNQRDDALRTYVARLETAAAVPGAEVVTVQ